MGIDITPGLHFSLGEYCYEIIQIEDTLAPYNKRTMAAKSLVEPIQAFCKLGDEEWWPGALRKDYHYIFMDQRQGQGYMVEGSLSRRRSKWDGATLSEAGIPSLDLY